MTATNSPGRTSRTQLKRRLESFASVAVLVAIVLATVPVLQPQNGYRSFVEWLAGWRTAQASLTQEARPPQMLRESITAILEPAEAPTAAELAAVEQSGREPTHIFWRIEKGQVLGYFEIKYVRVDSSNDDCESHIQDVISHLMQCEQPLTAKG